MDSRSEDMHHPSRSRGQASMDHSHRARGYAELLEEIKLRIEAIDNITKGLSPMRYKIAEDLCYLQLRMICELIALGCLVIHGNINSTKTGKLKKEYSADRIIKTLSRLHSDFYPVSLMPKDIPGNPPTAPDRESGYLSKDELVKLYNLAGSALHRGTIGNLILKSRKTVSFAHIMEWRNKIVLLLNRHRIKLNDRQSEVWFGMQHAESGKVFWNIMTIVGDGKNKI